MPDQIPFGSNDLPLNPELRLPCVLLLDVSGSMHGSPITRLNQALMAYRNDLTADPMACKRVEVALVTFGGTVQILTEFTTAAMFQPPVLTADGDTPMGSAILAGLDLLGRRKQEYKNNGVPYYRPWLFLITDGEPTDPWEMTIEHIRRGEASKAFCFFAVGVEGANFDVLRRLSVREPLKLEGQKFMDLFCWLSGSQKVVSRSNPGDEVLLPSPSGWASV